MNMKFDDYFSKVNLKITADNKFIYESNGRPISKKFTLTLEDLIKQFKRNGYTCPYTKENKDQYTVAEVERRRLPYMNFIYYYFIWWNMRVPSLDEFINSYLDFYCDDVGDGKYAVKKQFDKKAFTFTKEAIVGRLARSYNSFNREIQALLEFKQYKDLKVEYDLHDDLYRGIDLSIWRGKKYFGIASYVRTNSSEAYKNCEKNIGRHDYSKIQMIDMKAELGGFENCFEINGIQLYKKHFINRIYLKMVNGD